MAFYPEGLQQQTDLNTSTLQDSGYFNITPVRVKYTFLNLEQIKKDNRKLYDKYQGDFALGGVIFDSVSNPTSGSKEEDQFEGLPFALPLFPNFKQIPLVNEIAYIISFPSPNLQNPDFIDTNDTTFYYFLPINIWNSTHHNALPDPFSTSTKTPSEQKTNQQVEAGSRVKTTDGVDDIDLGETFDEQPNIRNLQPYEGDIIFEGRWGQSLRFSSTVTGSDNTWSSVGPNSKPITILRNGQYNDKKASWIPIVEDINQDSGSIYLTSTQQIPLKASSTNYESYSSYIPTQPDQYSKKQIIINSGRLVFNSNEDHILLSSKLTIGFNAIKGFNFDTKANFVINAPSIKLGSKDADEPLLLGDKTVELLNKLLSNLKTFADVCATANSTGPGPLVQINTIGSILSNNILALQQQLNSLKSKTSYTI
jgi:hypothetical protein